MRQRRQQEGLPYWFLEALEVVLVRAAAAVVAVALAEAAVGVRLPVAPAVAEAGSPIEVATPVGLEVALVVAAVAFDPEIVAAVVTAPHLEAAPPAPQAPPFLEVEFPAEPAVLAFLAVALKSSSVQKSPWTSIAGIQNWVDY